MKVDRLFKCLMIFIILPFALSVVLAVQASALEVRVGIGANPPLSFIDDQGQPAGLLVDVLDEVAAEADWDIVYVHDSFSVLLDRLKAHEIDLTSIAYSQERIEYYDFNQINVVSNWGVLYSSEKIEALSYFDLKGLRIAVPRKNIHQQVLRKMLENFEVSAQFLECDSLGAVFAAIDSGTADIGVVNRFFALSEAENYKVKKTPLIFNPIEIRYATAKGENANLLAEIDAHLEKLKSDPSSSYYNALTRWLAAPEKDPLPPWLIPALWGLAFFSIASIVLVMVLRSQVKSRTASLRQEVDKRSQAQKKLLAAERNYRTLVEGAHAVIIHLDQKANIAYINAYGEQLFGYRRGELVGQNVIGTIVPEVSTEGEYLPELIQRITEDPENYQGVENENVTKDGKRIWLSWANQPLLDQNGKVEGLLSVGLDITEKKRAERSRREYDLAKDTFISTAAHELSTPLTAVVGYAELLEGSAGTDMFSQEQRRDFLGIICEKGFALSRIVDDLLDVSRIQKGEPLPLRCQKGSFVTLVKELLSQNRTLNSTTRLSLEVDDGLHSEQLFDRDRMIQVMENLLSNAIKYSAPDSKIVITLASADEALQVAVIDQGIGMTSEQVKKMFDSFYRVDPANDNVSGLGLGMFIVRKVVEGHGGRVWVESTPEVGTKVYFTVPNFSGD